MDEDSTRRDDADVALPGEDSGAIVEPERQAPQTGSGDTAGMMARLDGDDAPDGDETDVFADGAGEEPAGATPVAWATTGLPPAPPGGVQAGGENENREVADLQPSQLALGDDIWDSEEPERRAGLLADVWAGARAGLAATPPMSILMAIMYMRLPLPQRYPLPPYYIATSLLEAVGLKKKTDLKERMVVSTVAHHLFGAGAGAVVGPILRRLPGPAVLKGALLGFAVWALSYVGWVPALGLARSTRERPGERNGLMIVSNVFWGALTALLFERFSSGNRGQ